MNGTDVWPATVLNLLNFQFLLAVFKYLLSHWLYINSNGINIYIAFTWFEIV